VTTLPFQEIDIFSISCSSTVAGISNIGLWIGTGFTPSPLRSDINEDGGCAGSSVGLSTGISLDIVETERFRRLCVPVKVADLSPWSACQCIEGLQ
jgi:hypothetical protein